MSLREALALGVCGGAMGGFFWLGFRGDLLGAGAGGACALMLCLIAPALVLWEIVRFFIGRPRPLSLRAYAVIALVTVTLPYHEWWGVEASLRYAGPDELLADAHRLVAARLAAAPNKDRFDRIEAGNLPASLQRAGALYALVGDDRVLLKKMGLGDFAGFILWERGAPAYGRPLAPRITWTTAAPR